MAKTTKPATPLRTLITAAALGFGVHAHAAVEIDTDFASNGQRAGVHLHATTAEVSFYNDLARLPDGTYVLVGFENDSEGSLLITLVSADGEALDTITLKPSSTGKVPRQLASVAVDSNGRIVVLGYAEANTNNDFVLATLTSDGSSLTHVKTLLSDVGTDHDTEPRDIAIDANDNVYVAGESTPASGTSSDTEPVLVRYNASAIDSNSGTISPAWSHIGNEGSQSKYEAVAIDSANSQVVAFGWSTANAPPAAEYLLQRFALNNSNPASTTRGTDNLLADENKGRALALDGTAAVVGGTIDDGTETDSFIQRVEANGDLDTAFGSNGTLTIEPGNQDLISVLDIVDDTADGFLYTGRVHSNSSPDETIIVGRLDDTGTPDSTFASGNQDGFVRFSYLTNMSAVKHTGEAITTDEESRFVVGGGFNSDVNTSSTRDQASAMAFTADVLATDGSGDGGGSGGGGSGGGGGAAGLGWLALLAAAGTIRRRVRFAAR